MQVLIYPVQLTQSSEIEIPYSQSKKAEKAADAMDLFKKDGLFC
jgi:hypothetical protein